MKRKGIKSMAVVNRASRMVERRSELLLNEAYVTLVKAAKANGITVEELIEQRKKVAKKKSAKK